MFAGCGDPDMGYVTGTVTLDGQPLEGATLFFQPDNGDRPSLGYTDADGYYQLEYSTTKSGARVGAHTVRISTYAEVLVDDETGNRLPGTPEKVPMKYNTKTELKKEVKAGRQTMDFELDSQGEIPGYAPSGENY
jgi:hypothetical protein